MKDIYVYRIFDNDLNRYISKIYKIYPTAYIKYYPGNYRIVKYKLIEVEDGEN